MKQEHFDVFAKCLDRMDEKVERVLVSTDLSPYSVALDGGSPFLYERKKTVNGDKKAGEVTRVEAESATKMEYSSLIHLIALSQLISVDQVNRHTIDERRTAIKEELPIILLASAITAAQLKSNYQKGNSNQMIDINEVSDKLFEILYEFNEASKKELGKKYFTLTRTTPHFLQLTMKNPAFFVTLNHELVKEGLEISNYQKSGDSRNPKIELSVSKRAQQTNKNTLK